VLGSEITAVLIDYSQTLSYIGLAIIFGFNALTMYKLRKERKIRDIEKTK